MQPGGSEPYPEVQSEFTEAQQVRRAPQQQVLTQVSQGHSINISINIEGAHAGAGQHLQAKSTATIPEQTAPNSEWWKGPAGPEESGADGNDSWARRKSA